MNNLYFFLVFIKQFTGMKHLYILQAIISYIRYWEVHSNRTVRVEFVHDQLESAASPASSLQDTLFLHCLYLSYLCNGVPVHLKAEFIHDIGHVAPPYIYFSVHCIKLISVAKVNAIILVSFVIIKPLFVEALQDFKVCYPNYLDERVQEGRVVE